MKSEPFGAGGDAVIAARFEFSGDLAPSFSAFAHARAKRLSLTGWIAVDGRVAVAEVEGPEALVGAFEMACCIGPEDCFVNAWRRENRETVSGRAGFEIRPRP